MVNPALAELLKSYKSGQNQKGERPTAKTSAVVIMIRVHVNQ